MEQTDYPDIKGTSQYSASVYDEPAQDMYKDRPPTPTSFECFIMLEGGRTSATDLLPSNVQKGKRRCSSAKEEQENAIFEASFLRAENAWLRENRRAGLILQEGTVSVVAELLHEGAEDIHQALLQFHLALGMMGWSGKTEEESSLRVPTTNLQDLLSGFEKCRQGLENIRAATEAIQKGSEKFLKHIAESNVSYAKFFGIEFTP